MKKGTSIGVLLVILTSINSVIGSDEILLKSRRFTPAKGITTATIAKIEAIPKRAHVLIQLEQIPTIKERKGLEAKGIKLLSYIPNKAWFVGMCPYFSRLKYIFPYHLRSRKQLQQLLSSLSLTSKHTE